MDLVDMMAGQQWSVDFEADREMGEVSASTEVLTLLGRNKRRRRRRSNK